MKILKFISQYKYVILFAFDLASFSVVMQTRFRELHAVCILMKSNETRLALNFRYCLNELFTHLHISASRNILFCFTNSRETMYKPGEILPTLRAYLKKLGEKTVRASKTLDIPLNS